MPVKNQIPSPATMKRGIVTILGDSGERPAPHIRRTLSADMSSKNWLHQNGLLSPSKNSPPSSSSSSSAGDEYFDRTPSDRDDVWMSEQGTAKTESWDSIFSKKKDPPPPPYVHPLVKRSSSSLSERSLEICTERLGSESGTDFFQPTNCSTEVLTEVCKENPVKRAPRYRSSPARPLPPPMPSVAASGGLGSHLHMHSRRENGRLIVEAVSVAPENYFEARRGDGRLVLTLVRGGEKMKIESSEELVDEGDEEFVAEKKLHCEKRLVMKTFVAVRNTNVWSNKVEKEVSIMQPLPPFPILARLIPVTPTCFNTYEYFWRNKTTVTCSFVNQVSAAPKAIKSKDFENNNVVNENRNLVIVKGNKGEDLVTYSSRGCMEAQARRSVLFWEPYCIATS